MDTETAPWWNVVNMILATGATLALALFAGVELWALRRGRITAERLAAARIATTGFLVRRQLRSWLGPGGGSPDDLEKWVRASQNAKTFWEHIDRAESRFVGMLETAGTASASIAADVDEAAALFFNGTEWLNRFVAESPQKGIAIADWVNLRDMAWRDLTDCVAVVDGRLASDGLLRTARRLAAKTRAEYPSMDAYLKRYAALLDQADRRRLSDPS